MPNWTRNHLRMIASFLDFELFELVNETRVSACSNLCQLTGDEVLTLCEALLPRKPSKKAGFSVFLLGVLGQGPWKLIDFIFKSSRSGKD